MIKYNVLYQLETTSMLVEAKVEEGGRRWKVEVASEEAECKVTQGNHILETST